MGPVDEYMQAGVLTASPQRLHLMVIDKALEHSRRAAQALDDEDLGRSHEHFTRAREFVAELLTGLRGEQAPELVTQVKEYFERILNALRFADMQQDRISVDFAIELLNEYRATWVELTSRITATA